MTLQPLFGFAATPEWDELKRLCWHLWPGRYPLPMQGLREFLNEQTGMQVGNGSVLECVRQWLPRLREMAVEKDRAA